MSRVASDALVEALDGRGLYTPERNLAIYERVPQELRLTEFSPRTLPDHPAFPWRLEGRATWRGFDLGALPEPMQRDFTYCMWRVIDSGLTRNKAGRWRAHPHHETTVMFGHGAHRELQFLGTCRAAGCTERFQSADVRTRHCREHSHAQPRQAIGH